MSTTTRRGTAALVPLATAAVALTGCGLIPAAEADGASGAVGFDQVQQAVIQLEARGTFVDPEYGGYEAAGNGSGFIISADGLAITNNHVVVGAGTLDVWRGGDQSDTLDARVLGASECLDIAVVQLEKGTYPYLDWHEGEIATGSDVYAAGFPLGDPNFTMTRGIVSKADIEGDTSWASIDSIIEHDAKIRPGNSGGPLVDGSGRVVGVNYAGETTYDYNFAIHRDEVQDVIEQLIAGESVMSLGINGMGLMTDEGGVGVWVSSVAAGSVADQAGVEPGDLITRMQGVSVGTDGTMREYCDVLRTHGTEAALEMELYRPAEGLYHRGQINGEPLAAVEVFGGGAQASGDFVDVVDDSGRVAVQIPAEWTDVDSSTVVDGAGNEWASIVASPSIARYHSSWSTPGVSVMASASALATTTVDGLMLATADGVRADGCTSEGAQLFTDGYHTGKYEYYGGCGGAGADYIAIAAVADSGAYLIYVTIQAVAESDLAAVDRIIGSFIADF